MAVIGEFWIDFDNAKSLLPFDAVLFTAISIGSSLIFFKSSNLLTLPLFVGFYLYLSFYLEL